MTSTKADDLKGRIANGSVKLATIGLGYVGLPLSVEFASSGVDVLGVDVDEAKVSAIGRGESYIQDVPRERLSGLVQAGKLAATTDFDRLSERDAIIICVPTPLGKTKDPDLSMVVQAAEEIGKRLRPGHFVVLESTTYPGTTEEIIRPILERGGLEVGKDFFLAFSPERVDPGNQSWNTRNTPKIIGGTTSACRDVALALYSRAVCGSRARAIVRCPFANRSWRATVSSS
jgi:UDP-N-acetyl-D-glucosamine dehydrogenase